MAGYLIDGFPPRVQCRQESVQFRCTAQVDDPGWEGLLAVPGELLRRAGARVSGHRAPSWGPASGAPPTRLTKTQYSRSGSVETALMSASSAVPRERKKLVWQSSWHVKRRSSVITRQQGMQGLGVTPCGMT